MFLVTSLTVLAIVLLAFWNLWALDEELENCHYTIRITAALAQIVLYSTIIYFVILVHNSMLE